MKKVYSFILITVFSASVFGQTVPSYVPTNGLVGWWPFNGNANDESGNGNNGTVNGATLTTDRFGNANKAYSFYSTNDFIEIQTNNGLLNSQNYTICFYYKTNLPGYTGFYPRAIISRTNLSNSPSNVYDNYCILEGGGSISINYQGVGTTFNTPSGSDWLNSVNNDIWHLLVVTVYNGQIITYTDGYLNKISTPQPAINFQNYPLRFGKSNHSYWSEFNGLLDDIGIWNRALTQAEITALYTANGVGIKDQSLNQLSIYPNPAKTQITLNATTNQIGKTLKVYDALGKVVYETILKQQQYNINITNWANGIYTVAIPEQDLTYKFVKE